MFICKQNVGNYIFYRYALPLNDANMYVHIKNKRAMIIDCYYDEELVDFLKKNDIKDITILLTHEHWDHASGVPYFKENFFNCKVLCGKNTKERLESCSKNMSSRYKALMMLKHGEDSEIVKTANIQPFEFSPDIVLEDEEEYIWEHTKLKIKLTPGHTPGSICIFWEDCIVFTGDSLVNGNKTVTRFPGSNKSDFEKITVPFLEEIRGNMLVFPGHGAPAKITDIIYNIYDT